MFFSDSIRFVSFKEMHNNKDIFINITSIDFFYELDDKSGTIIKVGEEDIIVKHNLEEFCNILANQPEILVDKKKE